jgi:ligand-binding SRPBCC domain-containing protein
MRARLYEIKARCIVPRPLAEVFPFFTDPRNLERLTPPSLRFQVLQAPRRARAGSLIDYRLRVHGLPLRWRSLILDWEAPHRFVDVAVQGPYALWHHEHRFQDLGGRTLMTDQVRYSLPFPPWGDWIAGRLVQADVARIFAYRAKAIRALFPPMPGSQKTAQKR